MSLTLAPKKQYLRPGLGQLTLVEHSLCPLDAAKSMVENLVHEATFQFTNEKRQRQTGRARVFCPLGLSPADELYLWGLLSLTLSQSDSASELRATPHWCLRQLGLIDEKSRRGGRQYRQFFDALQRLSAVTYLNDRFYDPVRTEHRRVSFGFLSYSLPLDLESSRAWRISWNPLFFEMVQAANGHLRFDLALYRQLDPASRRLFLLACKVLSRRQSLPSLDLTHVAIDLLGFSSTLATRDMKVKVNKCLAKLHQSEVLAHSEVEKVSPGRYVVHLERGPYFMQPKVAPQDRSPVDESPLWESLLQIGFEHAATGRLIRRYPARLLEEWADITQAAQEKFGSVFFRKSPMAFFVDSVSKAAVGRRTPPDWWHELRRAETTRREQSAETKAVIERLQAELTGSGSGGTNSPAKTGQALAKVGDLLTAKS
jgi:hypothetical protein